MQHLHQGKIYFGVEAMELWECNHSCWSEPENSGAPILDSHGYWVGMDLGAYLPHRYMEGVRVFIEGLNVQGPHKLYSLPPTASPSGSHQLKALHPAHQSRLIRTHNYNRPAPSKLSAQQSTAPLMTSRSAYGGRGCGRHIILRWGKGG